MGAAAARFSLPTSAREFWLAGASNTVQDSARYTRCASADIDLPLHGGGSACDSTGGTGRLSSGDGATASGAGPLAAAARRQRRGFRCCECCSGCASWAVYIWAVLLALAGASLLFHPGLGSPQSVSGTGLLACGAFFIINANYLLVFWRMVTEASRLRRGVSFYRIRVGKQLQKLRSLKMSDVALKEMDARFDGSAIVAKHDLPKLKAEVRESILQNVSDVCRLFVSPEPEFLVRAGSDLQEAMFVMGRVFGNEFSDFSRRAALLQQTLKVNQRFQEDGGIACKMLATLVAEALTQEEISLIPRCVAETMSEKAVTMTDEFRLAVEAIEAQE